MEEIIKYGIRYYCDDSGFISSVFRDTREEAVEQAESLIKEWNCDLETPWEYKIIKYRGEYE